MLIFFVAGCSTDTDDVLKDDNNTKEVYQVDFSKTLPDEAAGVIEDAELILTRAENVKKVPCTVNGTEISAEFKLEGGDWQALLQVQDTSERLLYQGAGTIVIQNDQVNISDFRVYFQPYVVGSCDIESKTGVWQIKAEGEYAYISEFGYGRFEAFNISSPESPFSTGYTRPDLSGVSGLYGFDITDNYTVVANEEHSISLIDISSPESMSVEVDSYSDTSLSNYMGRNLIIEGDYLYASGGVHGLQILNVSNPLNISAVFDEGYDNGRSHSAIAKEGSYVYLSGYYYPEDIRTGRFSIYDISQQSNPVEVGNVNLPNEFTHDIFISTGYAYIANGGAGLQIINVANLEDPEIINSLNHSGDTRGIEIKSNIAYICVDDEVNDNGGIYLYDVYNPLSQVFVKKLEKINSARVIDIQGKYAYTIDGIDQKLYVIKISL